nr:hypothetical protein [Microbacterium bovistercoris]
MSQTATSFDPRPLTEPVDKKAARAFWRRIRSSSGMTTNRIVGVAVAVVFLVFFVGVGSRVFGAFFSAGADVGGGMGALLVVVPVVFGLAVIGVLVAVVRSMFGPGPAVRAYRLDRFARANGMSYEPGLTAPQLPGMIFGQGSARRSADLVRGQRPRFVEFGNYQYTTGSGKEQTTHHWGYVAIKLDSPLPNIVLDAVSNNGLFGSNLPASFARGQRLHLEGDFDQHFALYCPEGYEQDALYLFTPDIMARFIDHAAALDVEIVDDWLFLYAQGRTLSTLDPATWAWMFVTVGALLDKMAQWARWRDDRLAPDAAARATTSGAASAPAVSADSGTAAPVDGTAPVDGAASLPFVAPTAALTPPPGVAPEGRRLRRSTPVTAIVIGVVIVGAWFAISTLIRF